MPKVIHHSTKPRATLRTNLLYLPFLGSLLSVISSSAFLSSTPSSASTSSTTTTTTIKVLDACTMSAASGSTNHTATIVGGTKNETVGTSIIDVLCNDHDGYSVYAKGVLSDGITPSTDLIGVRSNESIPTGTDMSTNVSNWSMRLSLADYTDTSTYYVPTILSDTIGTFTANHIIPSTDTKVVTYKSSMDSSNENNKPSRFTSTYAIAITPYQQADTYKGYVKYTIVHPNYTNADGTTESYPVTLSLTNADSIVIDGTTYTGTSATPNLTYGEHTISGTFPENYEFDNWSVSGDITIADTASSSTSINVTGSGTVALNGKSSKLWFQNATMADCGKTMYDNRGNDTYKNIAYTTAMIGSLCWMTRNLDLPGGTTLSQSDSNLNGSTTSYTLPASSTSGFSSYSGAYVYNSSSTYNDTSCGNNDPCYSYYSSVAATAGTNPSSEDASSDICPYGWRLPTNYEQSGITSSVSSFSPVYSGYYGNSRFYDGGSGGVWWSATAGDDDYQYYLSYYNGSLSTDGYGKRYGRSVRCVKSS